MYPKNGFDTATFRTYLFTHVIKVILIEKCAFQQLWFPFSLSKNQNAFRVTITV